jgi:hypothetical protein
LLAGGGDFLYRIKSGGEPFDHSAEQRELSSR